MSTLEIPPDSSAFPHRPKAPWAHTLRLFLFAWRSNEFFIPSSLKCNCGALFSTLLFLWLQRAFQQSYHIEFTFIIIHLAVSAFRKGAKLPGALWNPKDKGNKIWSCICTEHEEYKSLIILHSSTNSYKKSLGLSVLTVNWI